MIPPDEFALLRRPACSRSPTMPDVWFVLGLDIPAARLVVLACCRTKSEAISQSLAVAGQMTRHVTNVMAPVADVHRDFMVWLRGNGIVGPDADELKSLFCATVIEMLRPNDSAETYRA